MKKKVMCMLLTGMMAASMIAGCGNSGNASGNASANAGADTNTDASADAADSSADQSADVTPDTTAANSASAATGDFDNSEYINVVSREDGSGTRGAFIELFGVEEKNDAGEKIDNTTDEAIITNSTDVMLTTVSGDEYSIGYVSLGSLNDSVKAVSIDGAEATVDNIKSGDYTIARPFNIATKGTPSDVAQDVPIPLRHGTAGIGAAGQAVCTWNQKVIAAHAFILNRFCATVVKKQGRAKLNHHVPRRKHAGTDRFCRRIPRPGNHGSALCKSCGQGRFFGHKTSYVAGRHSLRQLLRTAIKLALLLTNAAILSIQRAKRGLA